MPKVVKSLVYKPHTFIKKKNPGPISTIFWGVKWEIKKTFINNYSQVSSKSLGPFSRDSLKKKSFLIIAQPLFTTDIQFTWHSTEAETRQNKEKRIKMDSTVPR